MLSRLTQRSAVVDALNEFDEKGRDHFLAQSNFGASRTYFVRWKGRLYDSKAIVGRALEIQHPDLGDLPHNAFHGGHPVRRCLEELGFEVVRANRRPDESTSVDATSPPSRPKRARAEIGSRVRHIRRLLGMTQEELGKKIGVHRGTISSWETARDQAPEEYLRAISDLVEPSDRAFRWMNLERTTQPTLQPKGQKRKPRSGGDRRRTSGSDAAAIGDISASVPPGGSADWPKEARIFEDAESIAAARRELLNWVVDVVDTEPEAAAYASSIVNLFNAAVERIEQLGGA